MDHDSESEYLDAIEDLDNSHERKGNSPMHITSHVIHEQGSSSEISFPENFRALLPLPEEECDVVYEETKPNPECFLTMKKPYKILIRKHKVEIKDIDPEIEVCMRQPQRDIKVKPPESLDDCIDKHVIYEERVSSDFKLGYTVMIWSEEC